MKTLEKPARQRIVSRDEWVKARKTLLAKEKELTHQRDALTRERMALPWVKVDKPYVFDAPTGKRTLADLFDGRGQLIVYHFMFGPTWDEGCPSCSYLMDHIDGALPHLNHRDVSFAAGDLCYNFEKIPAAPIEDMPGLSVFAKDAAGEVFHTYSAYARGLDAIVGTYQYLDLVPKGRDEDGLNFSMAWVRYHDRYDANYQVDALASYVPPKSGCCSHAEGTQA